MSVNAKISTIVIRMRQLAQRGGDAHTMRALEKVETLIDEDMEVAVKKIMAMYGGLGSLNDVILYEGNKPLIAENTEFDALRTELYDLCLATREA